MADLKDGIKSASDGNYFKNIGHFHEVVKNLTKKRI